MGKDAQNSPVSSGENPKSTAKAGDGQKMSGGEESGEANPVTIVTGNENDGKITLVFLDNDLEVRGDFFPNMRGGSPINHEYIKELLEKFKIVHGVRQEEINIALKKCVHEQQIVRNVLIARGDPPVNEIPEYMQLNPNLGQGTTRTSAGENVDHRSRSPFVIVRKGEALAKQKTRKPGREGKNVRGETLGFTMSKPEGVSGGVNTHMEERYLLADINGQMILAKGTVNVYDSLVIKGPVGYATGNIIFPGNVEIEGPVSDGFKIISGGSVTIKQTFDVTEAVTKGDLNVAGGIIGRSQALVKVGGSLKTKFIENCRVACRKNIIVESGIVNSNIFTLEALEMGDKSRIVGGEIYALKGIRTGGIGQKTGKAARIHCGIDFTVEQEKEKNNGTLRIIAAKLNRLRELMADPLADEEKKAKMEALLLRLEDEQQKAQTKGAELLGKTNMNKSAAVEVIGEITPGTLIEICQVALFVTTPLKKARIRLDGETGKLITESL